MCRNCGTVDHHHNVIIIGAGIAGLRCAYELRHIHEIADVLVVEASDRIGGRIMQNDTFSPGMKIDLGAEFVHGDNTSLTKLARKEGWDMYEIFTWAQGDGGPDQASHVNGAGYYFLGEQNRMLRFDDSDPDFCSFNSAVEALSGVQNVDQISKNQSMMDYFKTYNLSDSILKLAEAGYGNTAGGRLDDISLRVTCEYEKQWLQIEEDGDFRFADTYQCVVDRYSSDIDIKLSSPIVSVNYTDPKRILLTLSNKQQIGCNRLVITVPIATFNDIKYVPELPKEKLDAVNSFGMTRAIKIILLVSEQFWPSDTHGVICSDMFIPEFWINSTAGIGFLHKFTSASQEFASEVLYTITGFATSDFADKVCKFSKEDVIEQFVSQLDRIYGDETLPTPATLSFIKGMYFDWGDVPFIRGGYSYPKVGQCEGASEKVAKSIENRIFFAGEATSFERPGMAVHCAMDTGERAAREVLLSLRDRTV